MSTTSVAAQDAPEPFTGIVYEGGDGPGAGKHIVLVAGDEEYRSEEALPMLGKILATHHGFRCTVLFSLDEAGLIDPDNQGNIPGLAALDDADMLVLFTRFRRLPDEDMQHIVDYVESGRPVFGIRTATHAFSYEKDSGSPYAHYDWRSEEWPGGFGVQVLGETWVNHHGHHGSQSTRGVVPEAVREHPVLRGVADVWGPTDVYGIRSLPDDAVVLLEGAVIDGMDPSDPPVDGPQNDPRHPITWLRERPLDDSGKTQRVAASTLGAAIDLESEDLRRLFVNACYWGVGLEDEIPERSLVDTVGPYEPTMFGFGSYVKGVDPQSHALEADAGH
jgi:hypothetical protein